MTESKIKVTLDCSLEQAWAVVTDLKNYEWRSDLSRIELLEDGRHFVEYGKNGYVTHFAVTTWKPYSRYGFDMENDNMTGSWTGTFSSTEEGTVLEFRECVEVKKWMMKPFAGLYLHMQQKKYMDDLRRALKHDGRI